MMNIPDCNSTKTHIRNFVLFCYAFILVFISTISSSCQKPAEKYASLYCEMLNNEIDWKKLMYKDRIFFTGRTKVAKRWMMEENFEATDSTANEYYFYKLQYLTYKNCDVLKDHIGIIFESEDLGMDYDPQLYRQMITLLQKAETEKNTAPFATSDTDHASITQFQNILDTISDLLFFYIHSNSSTSYDVDYFYFNPNSEKPPLDEANRVMTISFILNDEKMKDFRLKIYQELYKQVVKVAKR